MPSSVYPEIATLQPEVIVMASGPLFLRLGVPSGMEDLLEGLAREVLRHQPRDIYRFAAVHFQGLLMQREATATAQNAALSPRTGDQDDIEPIKEPVPVTDDVANREVDEPLHSPASDSGAASGTSSPVGSPSRTPGPQAVRTKLTTTGNKHPSPVFQQALKTAFDAETLLSDRASISPTTKRNEKTLSPIDDDSRDTNTISPLIVSKQSSLNTSGSKNETNSGAKSPEQYNFITSAANNLSKFLPSSFSKSDSTTEDKSNASENRSETKSPTNTDLFQTSISNVRAMTGQITEMAQEKKDEILKQGTETSNEISGKVSAMSTDISEKANTMSNEVSNKTSEICLEVEEKANTAVVDIEREISNVTTEIEKKTESIVGEIHDAANTTAEKVNEEFTKMTTEMSEGAANIKTSVEENVSSQINAVNSEISLKSSQLVAQAELARNTVTQEVTEITQKVETEADDAISKASDAACSIENEIREIAGETSDECMSKASAATTAVDENIQELLAEASNAVVNANNQVEIAVSDIENKYSELEGKAAAEIEDNSKEISNQISEAMQDVAAESENLSTTIVETKHEIESHVDNMKMMSENSLEMASEKISEIKSETEIVIESTLNNVAEKTSEIKNEGENLIGEAVNEAKEIEKEASNVLDNVAENTKEKLTEAENEIESSVKNMLNETNQKTADIQDSAENVVNIVTTGTMEAENNIENIKETLAENVVETKNELINIVETVRDDVGKEIENQESKIQIQTEAVIETAGQLIDMGESKVITEIKEVEARVRKISAPIAIGGINITDERSTSPTVESPHAMEEIVTVGSFVAASSIKESISEKVMQEMENIAESSASKLASELGSEDIKPQSPEVVPQSPDQSTYDDVSAGVLLDDDADNIPVVPQIEELAQALIEEEASLIESLKEECNGINESLIPEMLRDDNSAAIAQEIINDAASNEKHDDLIEMETKTEMVEQKNLVGEIAANTDTQEETENKVKRKVTISTPPPSPDQQTLDTLQESEENINEESIENVISSELHKKFNVQINDEIACTAEAACDELDVILQEALIEANAIREEMEANKYQDDDDTIVVESIDTVIAEYDTKYDTLIENEPEILTENKEPFIVTEISTDLVDDSSKCEISQECKAAKQVRCECNAADSPIIVHELIEQENFAPSAPPPTDIAEENTEIINTTASQIQDQTESIDNSEQNIPSGDPTIQSAIPNSSTSFTEGDSSKIETAQIEEISTVEVARAVETAVEQLVNEISNDGLQYDDNKTSRETGEVLLSPTDQESKVQIVQEDATPSDSLQSSSVVGNEGLGAVSSVVIRYSISEADARNITNEETDRVEYDAYTKMDKDIADTLISAVRDSEETPTESGDAHTASAPEPSVTEPAEVASAQTSSSKDAASLEHDDLLVVHAEPAMAVLMDEEEALIDDIKRIESPTSDEKDAAATRIQASYRGYQVRKTNEAHDAEVPETEENLEMKSTEAEETTKQEIMETVEDLINTDVTAAGLTETNVSEVWHAVPAQAVEDEEQVLVNTEDQRQGTSSPSALVELLQNSTLVAASPLAYPEPAAAPQEHKPCNISTDLVETTTIVATAPLAYVNDSPSSTLQHLRETYSSSGECADISASQTEPCISWNGARAVDQESGELVTGDEDESVWATLEKEIEETKAATKIQAGFRGHKARQGLLQREDAMQLVTSSAGSDVAATPFSGVRHTGEFHDSLPLLPLAGDDPIDADSATKLALFEEAYNEHVEDDDMMSSSSGNFLDRAATKIQSTYRGFKTRNDLRKERCPVNSQEPRLPPMMSRVQSAPQILIQDSVEDRSAAKIQAGVRGYLTRQRLKRERSPQPPSSPEVEDAVVKIQAGFRGYKARQEVKSMREGKDS